MAAQIQDIKDHEIADTRSEASLDDYEDIKNETLIERIQALADIFPQHQRENLAKSAQQTAKTAMAIGKVVGNIAWVLTTSALILVLPLMFEMEKEQSITAFEQEQMMHQKALQPQSGQHPHSAPQSGPK